MVKCSTLRLIFDSHFVQYKQVVQKCTIKIQNKNITSENSLIYNTWKKIPNGQ